MFVLFASSPHILKYYHHTQTRMLYTRQLPVIAVAVSKRVQQVMDIDNPIAIGAITIVLVPIIRIPYKILRNIGFTDERMRDQAPVRSSINQKLGPVGIVGPTKKLGRPHIQPRGSTATHISNVKSITSTSIALPMTHV